MTDSTTKRCPKCGRVLPRSDFQKNSKRPDGLQSWCKACRKAHADAPERKRAKVEYDKQRYATHAEDFRAYNHNRYHHNPVYHARELERSRNRKYDPVYQERQRQRHYRRWADPEYRRKKTARLRYRRHNDPDYAVKVWYWRQERRARIKRQGKPFTHKEWIALCERHNFCCACCGQKKPLSRDHIIPVSKGGSSGIENIQPLCIDCNRRKNARTIDYRRLEQSGFEWGDD